MGEIWDIQPQNADIVETKKENNQTESTIDNTLKQKLPDDEEKQKFFFNIFQQNDIQKTFSTQEIIWYIKEKLNIRLFRKLKNISIEEQTKSILEDMDTQIRKENWSLKEIKTYNKTNIQTNESIKTLENIEKQKDIGELFLKAKESYNKLDAKYKAQSTNDLDKVEQIKKNISPDVQKKLQEQDLDISIYANFVFTEQTYGEELRQGNNTEFLKNYEKLNNILNTTSFSSATRPEKTDLIIDSNENLQDYINDSDTLNEIKLPIDEQLNYSDEEFDLYVKFIDNQAIKADIEANKKEIQAYAKNPEKNNTNETESISKAYEAYTTEVTKIKSEIGKSTEDIVQKRVLGSCISWLASYFDSTTIDKKANFADDFSINTQEWFSIEDDILSIKGNIQGNDIGFEYNMTEGQSSNLTADDFLHYDKTNNSFTLGAEKWATQDLGIRMPTIDYLSQEAQKFSEDNFQKELAAHDDIASFQEDFKKNLSENLAKSFGQKTIVETRVKRDIQKNITTQTLQSTFIPETILANIDQKGKIDTNNKTTRALFDIRETTTENMRSDELERLNTTTKRFNNVIGNLENNSGLEANRKEFLGKVDEEKWWETPNRGTNIVSFFQKISKDNKINVEDFELLVNILEKDAASIGENIDKFSPEFQTQEDQSSADKLLENFPE